MLDKFRFIGPAHPFLEELTFRINFSSPDQTIPLQGK